MLIVALTIPVIIMGFIVGVTFETGLLGILAFMLLAGLWGLIFNGFPYAIAFKTGNVAAVNLSFLLFFPFLFMTTLFIPQEQMTPWLSTTADFNPVTYILAAERSLITGGWQWIVHTGRGHCHAGCGGGKHDPGPVHPAGPGDTEVAQRAASHEVCIAFWVFLWPQSAQSTHQERSRVFVTTSGCRRSVAEELRL